MGNELNKQVFMPTDGVESWRKLLADPEKQWRIGYSARTLANDWEENSNLPQEIKKALFDSKLDSQLILVLPEYKVSMPGKGGSSQNDVFALMRDNEGLSVMMVEGKVSEPFDKIINKWRNQHNTDNKDFRIKEICEAMDLNIDIEQLGGYYYQLFHRTASAIFTADIFFAKKAIMLVHSYSKTDEWFDKYSDFVKLLNSSIKPEKNKIHKIKTLNTGIDLYIGWVHGNEKYLEM